MHVLFSRMWFICQVVVLFFALYFLLSISSLFLFFWLRRYCNKLKVEEKLPTTNQPKIHQKNVTKNQRLNEWKVALRLRPTADAFVWNIVPIASCLASRFFVLCSPSKKARQRFICTPQWNGTTVNLLSFGTMCYVRFTFISYDYVFGKMVWVCGCEPLGETKM